MNHTPRRYQYAATCALTKAHSSLAHARLERDSGADLLTQLGVPRIPITAASSSRVLMERLLHLA